MLYIIITTSKYIAYTGLYLLSFTNGKHTGVVNLVTYSYINMIILGEYYIFIEVQYYRYTRARIVRAYQPYAAYKKIIYKHL